MQRMKPRFKFWNLAIIVPLFAGAILNMLVRPYLAEGLGGTEVRKGASVRGGDRWWTFDEATRQDHPWLTQFLTWSDGQIGLLMLVLVAVCLATGWMVATVRKSRTGSGEM